MFLPWYGWSVDHDWANMIMVVCNVWVNLTVYEFEGTFDPSYLNLDKNDPNSWKIYSEKVREIYHKLTGLPKVDMGLRDK